MARALASQNAQLPGGRVEQGLRDLTLRTYGRVATPAAFGDIVIANRDGTPCGSPTWRGSRTRSRNGDVRERQRRARGRPPGPQAVGHEHDRGRAAGEGAPGEPEAAAAEGLPARRRARPVRVHRRPRSTR